MVDKANPGATGTPDLDSSSTPPAARRGSPFRGNDVRDSMAELAARAQLISQEAGTKVAAAMKDVISAAAGIAGFAIESARDLVQYMVRRGQMTPEEGEKLLREAEQAHARRPAAERERATANRVAADRAAAAKAARLAEQAPRVAPPARPKPEEKAEPKAAPAHAAKPARKTPAKTDVGAPARTAAKKAGAKATPKSAKGAKSAGGAKPAPAKKKSR